METVHENISAENIDGKLSDVTSTNESKTNERKEKEIRAKLQFYESQCKRYSLQKVRKIQECVGGAEVCSLDHYGIGSLQCQVMFETFAKPPVTQLTSISMKNNQLESFCCHSIASFIQISATLKELMLDGCKYVVGSQKDLNSRLFSFKTDSTSTARQSWRKECQSRNQSIV